MENRMNRVIRACIEMGENNPIVSIHDQVTILHDIVTTLFILFIILVLFKLIVLFIIYVFLVIFVLFVIII